jgi:predicted outer membrane repeat protein
MRFAKRQWMWPALILALAPLLAVAQPQPAAAAGVVTECTEAGLRAAVAAGGGVTFRCKGTITLTSPLVITQNTDIAGDGKITLSGSSKTRLITIAPGVEMYLSGLSLVWGNSTFSGNLGQGGAIYNEGRLTVIYSTFSNNSASSGGAIFNTGAGSLTIYISVFTNNSASQGGAISNDGTLVLKGSTLAGNRATLAANAAGGAGLANGGSGSVSITNSTFTGNETLANGGAIVNSGRLSVSASTLVGNNAYGGSAIGNNFGVVELTASILGGSGRSGACGGRTAVTSGGANVASDHSCNLTAANDLQGVDPRLGSLADNNGITPTMLPQRDSPAVDRMPNQLCADLSRANNGVDQRGNNRPVGNAPCDSGSAELTRAEWCGWKTGRSPEPPELNGWEC